SRTCAYPHFPADFINYLAGNIKRAALQRPTSGIQAHSPSFPPSRGAGLTLLPIRSGTMPMNLRIYTLIAIAAFATGAVFDSVPAQAQFTQQGPKLVGTGYAPGPTPLQGISVAVSADGNTLVSGGSGNNDSSGAAWVFTRAGGVWSQQAML